MMNDMSDWANTVANTLRKYNISAYISPLNSLKSENIPKN